MTGCPSPNNSTTGGGDETISFTAKAAEGDTTPKIIFTFSKPVTDLAEDDITITNKTGEATKGALEGDGKVWELEITVTKAGTISVVIDQKGIATGSKSVMVTLAKPPAPEIGGNLGPVTAVNSETQQGWCTNGTDDIETDLAVETLINAQYLKLVLGSKPSGSIQIIWQGDGNGWDWASTAIAGNDGTLDADKGAEWEDATKTLTIELSKAFKGYENLKDSYKAKFYIAYYSNNFDDLGIVSADLIASLTPINFVFVTFDSDGGNFNDDPTKTPIPTQIVRLVSGETMGAKFPADPLKAGFHLDKWIDTANKEYTASTVITANVTVKAVWAAGDPVSCTVSFDTDGGVPTAIASVTVNAGSSLGSQYPDSPTKKDFVFAGWFDAAKEYASTTAITTDTSLKAKWTAIVYPTAPDKAYTSTTYIKVQTIAVDGGNTVASLGDWAIGKGYIRGDDLAAIKTAPEGSIIVIYGITANSGHGGYGAGTINGVGYDIPSDYEINTTFIVTKNVADLLISATATAVFVNPWDDAIQRLELWKPDPNAGPLPVLEVTLSKNESGGVWNGWQALADQGLLFNGYQIAKDDSFLITFTFKPDKDIPYLNFFLVDNSETGGWWTELSDNPGAVISSAITAATGHTGSVTITADKAGSSSTAANANKLGFFVGTELAETYGPVKLTFTEFSITKQ